MSDRLEYIKKQISAMSLRTIANGCTEHEAEAAADKIASLLSLYNLTMTEVEAMSEPTSTGMFWTGYKVKLPYSTTAVQIMYLTDSLVWFKKDDEGFLVYNYFGLTPDVSMATYLLTLVHRAMHTEQEKFKQTDLYQDLQSGSKRGAFKSFQTGFASRMSDRIMSLIEQKHAEEAAQEARQREDRMSPAYAVNHPGAAEKPYSNSTALALAAKSDRIEKEMRDKYGFVPKIKRIRMSYKSRLAFEAGKDAANSIQLNKPLEETVSSTLRIATN